MRQQPRELLVHRKAIIFIGGLFGLTLAMGLLERLIEIGNESSPPAWNGMTLVCCAGFVGIASLMLGGIFYLSKWGEHKGMTAAFSAGGAVVLCFLCSGWRIIEGGKIMISLVTLLGSGLVFFALVYWLEGIWIKSGIKKERVMMESPASSFFTKDLKKIYKVLLSVLGLLLCALLMVVVFWGLPLRNGASNLYQNRAVMYPILFLAFFFAWNALLGGLITALKQEKRTPHFGVAVISGTLVILAAFLVGILYGLDMMQKDGLFNRGEFAGEQASMFPQFLYTFLPFLQYLLFSAAAFFLWKNRRKKEKSFLLRKGQEEPSGI